MQKYIVVFCLLFNRSIDAQLKKSSDAKKTVKVDQPAQADNSIERTIEIINDINEQMLEVHQFGKHKPDKFNLSINNKPLEQKQVEKIKIKNDELLIQYDYEFAGGLYKGSKLVHLKVKPNAKKVMLSFSWKDPLRIQADGAVAQSIEPAKKA